MLVVSVLSGSLGPARTGAIALPHPGLLRHRPTIDPDRIAKRGKGKVGLIVSAATIMLTDITNHKWKEKGCRKLAPARLRLRTRSSGVEEPDRAAGGNDGRVWKSRIPRLKDPEELCFVR
jgi:hypothetical protein